MLNVSLCVLILTLLAGTAGCRPTPAATPAPGPGETPIQTQAGGETQTDPSPAVPPTPTETNEPLAARVNGEGILLAEYEAELGRYQAALAELGRTVPEDEQRQAVLDELVGQVLLAQAAYAGGFSLDDAALDARIAALGDSQAVAEWQAQHGYSTDQFRAALRRQAAAAWQRDQIAAGVGDTAEQVHARQILVFDRGVADQAYQRLQGGADFATTARQYDPTGGELGWFPHGYLTLPEIEAAAFALQPGEYSEVIETSYGFHIVQTIERDPAHPLSADVRRFLQHQALAAWLADQRSSSEIEVLLP